MGIETLIGAAAIASIGATVAGGIQSYGAAQTQAEGAGVAAQGELVAAEGSRVGAEGARKAAAARSQAAMYRAAVARNNQQLATQYAGMERKAGDIEAEKAGLKTRQNLGTAKAIQSASGLDVGSGSAKDVRDSIKDLGALDAETIRSNAAKKAFGYDITATQQGASAELADMEARAEIEAGEYTAKAYEYQAKGHEYAAQGQRYRAQGYEDAGTASLISTAGSVADKWLGFQTKGVNFSGSGNAFFPSSSFMNNSWGY